MRQKSDEKASARASTVSNPTSTFDLFDDGRVTRRQQNQEQISRDNAANETQAKKQYPRYTKKPVQSNEEGFFSYISPAVEENIVSVDVK
jgi:putative heme iron utilization protein